MLRVWQEYAFIVHSKVKKCTLYTYMNIKIDKWKKNCIITTKVRRVCFWVEHTVQLFFCTQIAKCYQKLKLLMLQSVENVEKVFIFLLRINIGPLFNNTRCILLI